MCGMGEFVWHWHGHPKNIHQHLGEGHSYAKCGTYASTESLFLLGIFKKVCSI